MLSDFELLCRLLLSAVLGSIIGLERERLSWAAGLRTHMLVCVGSCLVMIISAFGFNDIVNSNHVVLDPSRMAAQVVSGIGFLGAGAILLRGEVVRGLTTAASLWTVSAIGLAVGGGLYVAAGASTAIILIILAGIKPLEDRYKDKRHSCQLLVQVKKGQFRIEMLQEILGKRTSNIKQFIIQPSELAEYDEANILLSRVNRQEIPEIIAQLEKLPAVTKVVQE